MVVGSTLNSRRRSSSTETGARWLRGAVPRVRRMLGGVGGDHGWAGRQRRVRVLGAPTGPLRPVVPVGADGLGCAGGRLVALDALAGLHRDQLAGGNRH